MPRINWSGRAACAAVVCISSMVSSPVFAGVAWSGDVYPADPTTWTSSTWGYIGKTGSGTLDMFDDLSMFNGSTLRNVGYASMGRKGE